jgi:hypothetical protein
MEGVVAAIGRRLVKSLTTGPQRSTLALISGQKEEMGNALFTDRTQPDDGSRQNGFNRPLSRLDSAVVCN